MSAAAPLRRLGRAARDGFREGLTDWSPRSFVWISVAIGPALALTYYLWPGAGSGLVLLVALWASSGGVVEGRAREKFERGDGPPDLAVRALASIQASGELTGTFDVLVRFASEFERDAFYAAARAAKDAQKNGDRS